MTHRMTLVDEATLFRKLLFSETESNPDNIVPVGSRSWKKHCIIALGRDPEEKVCVPTEMFSMTTKHVDKSTSQLWYHVMYRETKFMK